MSKKKIIGVALILALILLIGGMIAYFTDVTDPATNVFTLGDKVDISLSEGAWVAANGQGVHPGTVVNKNPTVKNESSSTPAYVFVEVTVPAYATTGTTVNAPLFTFTPNAGWAKIKEDLDTTNKTIKYVYAYGSTSAMTSLAANATTNAVFDSVTLEPTLTVAQKETAPTTTNIVVKAYGIQTDGLGTATTPAAIFDLF